MSRSHPGAPEETSLAFSYFPPPLPDEMLYSLLARYRENLGIRAHQSLKASVGLLPASTNATWMPDERQIMQMVFGKDQDIDGLLFRHTYAPYLAAFSSQEAWIGGKGARVPRRSMGNKRPGIVGVSPHSHLLFCPQCVIDDLNRSGQAGWKRVHQLPGVVVCPWHDIGLRVSSVSTRTNFLLPCPSDPKAGTELASEVRAPFALSAARLNLEILENTRPALDRTTLCSRIIEIALAHGWSSPTREGVSSRLASYVLGTIGHDRQFWGKWKVAELTRNLADSWGRKAANPAGIRPLFYVAILAVLGQTIADFHREPGTVVSVPEEASGSQDRVVRRKKWSEAALPRHRAAYLAYRADYPLANRRQVTHALSGSAKFLRKHDPEWLNENSPAPTRHLNWAAKDSWLTAEALAAVERIRSADVRPFHITQAAILREMAKVTPTPQKWNKLPETAAAIRGNLESADQIMARRLLWTACDFVRRRVKPTLTDFRKSFDWSPRWNWTVRMLVKGIWAAVEDESPTTWFEGFVASLPTDGPYLVPFGPAALNRWRE